MTKFGKEMDFSEMKQFNNMQFWNLELLNKLLKKNKANIKNNLKEIIGQGEYTKQKLDQAVKFL